MAIGLGTAALGRPQYINLKQEENTVQDLDAFKEKGIQVLEVAYRSGIRFFDTAPGYGLAEQLMLDWLQTKNDASIEVSTKWGYTYVANFDPKATVHEVKEHSLAKLNAQWQVSRGLLPHLKLYQIHSATLDTGVLENEQVLNSLYALKMEHKLQMGVTTSGANQTEIVKKALDVAVNGTQLFDAFQVTYNVLEQGLEGVCQALKHQHKKVLVKEALANGRIFSNADYPHYGGCYRMLESLAKKYDVGTDAIALQFCAQTLPDSMVLSGASNVAHLEANLKAEGITLSEEEVEKLKTCKVASADYWEERKRLNWQ
ncbi:aldo/keto reductase [Maribacter sp. 2307ULW6-5]|uniref:aldo/keto reductase n=1 Tax=Maribacter sp. 2307ULW6-5 TaxID=3386275 RepID=UPI0039BD66D1